jgi:hypothetical protein
MLGWWAARARPPNCAENGTNRNEASSNGLPAARVQMKPCHAGLWAKQTAMTEQWKLPSLDQQ